MIATPPAPLPASDATIVAAGNMFSQTARSAVSQCVSCRRVMLPASSHLLMRWRFNMFCTEWGSTSHRTFHEAKPGPSDALRSLRAANRSAGVCSAMRSAHVVPCGNGVWCRMVHKEPGERIRASHSRSGPFAE